MLALKRDVRADVGVLPAAFRADWIFHCHHLQTTVCRYLLWKLLSNTAKCVLWEVLVGGNVINKSPYLSLYALSV